MKQFFMLLAFLTIMVSCSHDRDEPVIYPTRKGSPRYGCNDAFAAFTFPNAEYTFYNQYSYFVAGNTINLTWRTTAVPQRGYFSTTENPTVKIRLYGPAPNYPVKDSLTVTNTGGTSYTFKTTSDYPSGWYYFTIQSAGIYGGCKETAVDFNLSNPYL